MAKCKKNNMKEPKIYVDVNSKKEAKSSINANSFYDKKPTWRFSKVDKFHSKWKVNEGEFDSILFEKLRSFENMKWKDILTDKSGRYGTKNHFISPEYIHKDAQDRLASLQLEELAQDSLCSIALSGKIRLWGLLLDGVFNIIWLDNEHEICPSKKRHT